MQKWIIFLNTRDRFFCYKNVSPYSIENNISFVPLIYLHSEKVSDAYSKVHIKYNFVNSFYNFNFKIKIKYLCFYSKFKPLEYLL